MATSGELKSSTEETKKVLIDGGAQSDFSNGSLRIRTDAAAVSQDAVDGSDTESDMEDDEALMEEVDHQMQAYGKAEQAVRKPEAPFGEGVVSAVCIRMLRDLQFGGLNENSLQDEAALHLHRLRLSCRDLVWGQTMPKGTHNLLGLM